MKPSTHAFIIPHIMQDGRTMLLMEYCERGDLCKALRSDSNNSKRLFSWYCWDAQKKLGGLAYRSAIQNETKNSQSTNCNV
jgi:hypothetical protein